MEERIGRRNSMIALSAGAKCIALVKLMDAN